MAELSLEYGIPTTFSQLFESSLTPELVGRVLDRLEVGAAADVVTFDPDTIALGPEEIAFDLPGGAEDFRFVRHAVGIERVFVNGEEAYAAESGPTKQAKGEIATYRRQKWTTPIGGTPAPVRAHTHPEPRDD